MRANSDVQHWKGPFVPRVEDRQTKVERKTEIKSLDGTPEKRLYWSIINDYGLVTALTELIDNCFDNWMVTGKQKDLLVAITLDVERQLITLSDNAGGVKQRDLRLLVAPGGSNNDPDANTIGVFGVGSKRAVVAIAEQIAIRTRYESEGSYQIDITPEWLESTNWEMPSYAIPDIDPGTTTISFSSLRSPLANQDRSELLPHLGETYDTFLRSGRCRIVVDSDEVQARSFDSWAYPPDYPPLTTMFEISPDGKSDVIVEVQAGLILDRDPALDNYGVYVYCNDRLVVKEWRSRDVGYFITGEAGVPHTDASLCRVIARFAGPAKLMPWNSSKTEVTPKHPTFLLAAPTIRSFCSQFSKLSRATKKTWDETVIPYKEGEMSQVDPENALDVKKLSLPKLPRVRKDAVEHLIEANQRVVHNQVWVVGLIEAMCAVDIIRRQRLRTKNRIALILIDSTYEIALKEYIVHKKDLFGNYDLTKLITNRTDVVIAIRKHIDIPQRLVDLADHFYELRNKLIHERATSDVYDEDIDTYSDVVKEILTRLFYVVWP